jgi:hypothetical protein
MLEEVVRDQWQRTGHAAKVVATEEFPDNRSCEKWFCLRLICVHIIRTCLLAKEIDLTSYPYETVQRFWCLTICYTRPRRTIGKCRLDRDVQSVN